jgi:hypothetical protein
VNELLRVIPPTQRSLVRAKGKWLAADLKRWARPVDRHLSPALYENLGFTAAAVAPTVRRKQLALLVRYGAWIYLLDDRLDGADVTVREMHKIGRSIPAVVRASRPPANGDFLECGLVEIFAGLSRYDDGAGILTRFADAVVDGVSAAVEHAERSRQVAHGEIEPPSAEDYLAVASRHINYRSLALGLVLLVGERPSAPLLDILDTALFSASRAVRLANDLRTAPKDAAEGSLNILCLRTRAGQPVTPERVIAQIGLETRAHQAQLQTLVRWGLALTCQALDRSLRVAVGLYRIADFKHDSRWSRRAVPTWSAPRTA